MNLDHAKKKLAELNREKEILLHDREQIDGKLPVVECQIAALQSEIIKAEAEQAVS